MELMEPQFRYRCRVLPARIAHRLERLCLAIDVKDKSTCTISDGSILTECHDIKTPGAVKSKQARDGQVRDAAIGVGEDRSEIVRKSFKVTVVEERNNGAKNFMCAHHRIAPHQDTAIEIARFCFRQIIRHGFKPLALLPHFEVGIRETFQRETRQGQARDEVGIICDQLLLEESECLRQQTSLPLPSDLFELGRSKYQKRLFRNWVEEISVRNNALAGRHEEAKRFLV